MKAFNNKKALKKELIAQLKHHQKLDTFIQGTWITGDPVPGNGKKGCFYGCTMQTEDEPREKFSQKYDIDLWYCFLTERLFEGLPDGEFQKFPVESIEIIPVGFDFDKIKSPFFKANLLKQLEWVKDKGVRKVIMECAALFDTPFGQINEEAAESAESAARSARSAAWSAAESAWYAAEYAAKSASESAARSAKSAAWSAAESARSAAESARSAAESAWSAAESAWSAAESAWYAARYAARSAARSAAESAARSAARSAESAKKNHYIWMRDTLFQIIRDNS
jgi:hypothetical protein